MSRVRSEAADAATPRRPARRILVVDDNVDSARTLALLLQLCGHEVATAHDGVAALETARSWRPEIVLLDIGLPCLDGYEVARRLRQDTELQHIALFALTGYGCDDDRHRAWEAGFNVHLVKPVDVDELRTLLAHAESLLPTRPCPDWH